MCFFRGLSRRILGLLLDIASLWGRSPVNIRPDANCAHGDWEDGVAFVRARIGRERPCMVLGATGCDDWRRWGHNVRLPGVRLDLNFASFAFSASVPIRFCWNNWANLDHRISLDQEANRFAFRVLPDFQLPILFSQKQFTEFYQQIFSSSKQVSH